MPSPFPGMDPFLENPATWGNFHVDLISEIKSVLNQRLRPKYYARAEERVYVSGEDDLGRRAIIPDVRVVQGREEPGGTPWGDAAAVAVAEPVVLTTLIEDEIHEARVEIIDTFGRRVVSVIEVVSPTNKIEGAVGQRSYRQKRAEVMNSSSHWVEIDLLREGMPLVAQEALPKGDYFVHVSRVEERPRGCVWPIRLRQRLPVIPIPLLTGDPDFNLDLRPMLDAVYDRGAYDLDIDYKGDPIPKLPPEYAAWADQWLRGKGLRS